MTEAAVTRAIATAMTVPVSKLSKQHQVMDNIYASLIMIMWVSVLNE